MITQLTCPCGQSVEAISGYAHLTVSCPTCGRELTRGVAKPRWRPSRRKMIAMGALAGLGWLGYEAIQRLRDSADRAS